MPIKFHCQHCDQLLGISRSRAGAIVDCPQCGRSLRVPELDGRTRKMPRRGSSVKTDSGLISALSELSALGTAETPGARSATSSSATSSPATAVSAPTVKPEPLEVGTVPLERVDDGPASEVEIDDGPVALSESLAELASISDPDIDAPLSGELLAEMQRVSHPSASPLLTIFGGLLLLLLGAVGGWWMGRSAATAAAGSEEVAALQNQQKEAVDELQEQPGPAATVDGSVSGTVTYVDSAGTSKPDAGALVLLLPTKHEGSFRLHARAFRKPPNNPDRIATMAALTAIGGAATVTDDDGKFHVDKTSTTELTAIVVSRNETRPADVTVAVPITAFLDSWFDSASHICGQLAVQMKDTTDSNAAVDFHFAAAR